MKNLKIRRFCFMLFFLWPLLIVNARADELVTCRYLKSEGREIELEVTIASPPPATVIVVQKLPAGVGIVKATPDASKFNKRKGVAKWLLGGVNPGAFIMAMTLDRPVRSGQIRGEVRYMDPVSGAMVTMPFTP